MNNKNITRRKSHNKFWNVCQDTSINTFTRNNLCICYVWVCASPLICFTSLYWCEKARRRKCWSLPLLLVLPSPRPTRLSVHLPTGRRYGWTITQRKIFPCKFGILYLGTWYNIYFKFTRGKYLILWFLYNSTKNIPFVSHTIRELCFPVRPCSITELWFRSCAMTAVRISIPLKAHLSASYNTPELPAGKLKLCHSQKWKAHLWSTALVPNPHVYVWPVHIYSI